MVKWTCENRTSQLMLEGSRGRGAEEATIGELLQSRKAKCNTEEGSQDEQRAARRAKDRENA
jgi:hypothetical protein